MLKQFAVLFVSCLSGAVLSGQAMDAAQLPVSPIQQLLESPSNSQCKLPHLRSQPMTEALHRLYQHTGYQAIWQDSRRLNAWQNERLALRSDGLNPAQYNISAPVDASAACSDLHDSAHYLLALEHLSRGRLDQQQYEPVWQAPAIQPPARPTVAELGISGLQDMPAAFDQARPSLSDYRLLRQAWPQLNTGQVAPPPFPGGTLLKPGSSAPRLPLLIRHLTLTGHFTPSDNDEHGLLPTPQDTPPLVYDEYLQQAVRAFQDDQGLQPDAIVGPQTVAALNISPLHRHQQVRINLERLRWLSARRQQHSLVVNAAGSTAILYDGDTVRWHSRVQSGSARRATPLLDSRINRVTLNPSWTIPPTIMREDRLPQIRANPDYFVGRNLLVLDYSGNRLDPASIDWRNPQGILLREPPGPDNPLGRMVFRFDNPFSVFLHDTPSQALFARAVRNVSAGCVRVEQAAALADYLFYSLDHQLRERIEQRMASGKTHEIPIANGPQVLLSYWTAEGTGDGRLRFTPDPYQLDERLIRAYHRAAELQ